MRKLVFIVLIFLFNVASFANSKPYRRVLFLGNSYTAVNNLPQLVSNLAQVMYDSLYFDANTPGGYTLSNHCNDAVSLAKIAQGNWDYVVIQAQSQEPSFSPTQVANDVLPYAHILDSLIHKADSCTETLFYMTWGRKNGDISNCSAYPPVCTYAGMQSRLRSSYLLMAQQNNASVAPVGAAWREVINSNPAFDLYQSDESHPSIYGSYLTACVFYSTIFQKEFKPYSFTQPGISTADALFLRQKSNQVVFDSLALWYDTGNIPFCSYSYQAHGDTVQFFSALANVDSIHWDVLNMGNSVFTNPYFVNSNHLDTLFIILKVFKGCHVDSTIDTLFLPFTSTRELSDNRYFRAHYEKSKNELKLFSNHTWNDFFIELYDLEGKLILNERAKETISISLKPGLYFLKLRGKNSRQSNAIKIVVY